MNYLVSPSSKWTVPALLAAGIISSALIPTSASAAAIASDVASNYTTATWINGSNGGTGFGAWSHPVDANFQKAIENSNLNGGTPNINTSNLAFRIRRNGGFNQVSRGFTVGGPNASAQLADGQSFKFSLDWEAVGTSQSVGFWLTDAGSGERWGLQYTGGTANLILKTNGGGNQDTGISVASLNNGADVTFNLGTGGAWTATVAKLGGSSFNLSSSTFGALAASPDGFRFFVAGNGANLEHYINNLAIVPEPSTLGLLGLGGLFLARRRRVS